MNRIRQVVCVAALAGFATSVSAADLPLTRTPVAPVAAINWTGLYIGGGIGGAFNSTDYTRPNSGLSDITIGSIDSRPAFDAYAGFNLQVAPWAVIGIEGSGTFFDTATYRELGPNLDFLQETRNVSAVTGRAGLVLRPDTMVYGKVGPAWIETEGFEGFGGTFRKTLSGVQGGLGIESLIAPNLILRGEVSYTYATQQLMLNQGFDVYRPSVLMFDLGLAYKFDAPAGWGVPGTAAVTPASSGMFYKARAHADAAPGPRWTGFEVGGFASVNGNQVALSDTLIGETGPYTSSNLGGGWFAGANYQFQRLVIGVEASGNYEKAVVQTATGSGGLAQNFYNFARIDQALSVTARVGWLITPDTLLYAKGGPSELRLTPSALYFTAVAPGGTFPTMLAGYQAGGGVETFVTDRISLRAEGVYTYTPDTIILNGLVTNEFKLKPYLLSGTVGAALHF